MKVGTLCASLLDWYLGEVFERNGEECMDMVVLQSLQIIIVETFARNALLWGRGS